MSTIDTTMTTYCEQTSKASNSNFVLTFKLLPEKQRQAMYAFYTICREIDDIVDDLETSETAKRQGLDNWKTQIEALYGGKPTHPAVMSIQSFVQEHTIPKEYFDALLEGCEMDLLKRRYETFEELYRYCYGVASAVGKICTYIFGCKHPRSLDYAEALGLAFQLTNISRDVATDLERNRIYLPLEDLRRFDYSEQDLTSKIYNENFKNLMKFQCARAEAYYQKAASLLPREDRKALLTARLMAQYYHVILNKIEKVDYQVFDRPIRVSKLYKLLMLASFWPRVMMSRWL